MIKFRTLQTTDQNLQIIQDSIDKAVRDLASQPFSDGRIIDSVALIAGQPNVIQHLLSRSLANWSLTDLNANSVVWRESSDDKLLTLRCSANCTVSLWVS